MSGAGTGDLLPHYYAELTRLREEGAEFARKYPKVAARLELGGDESADPHVERLIESFAFLTARIQRGIEEDLPEVTSALLDVLYPHYLHPVPSMTVARFDVDPKQGKLTTGRLIPKHTQVVAHAREGEEERPAGGGPDDLLVRFRTCYPLTLWPLRVESADFVSTGKYEFLNAEPRVARVLRVRVGVLGEMKLGEMELRDLRFYLDGEMRTACALHELLFAQLEGVALLPEGSDDPVLLGEDESFEVAPVGFGPDEAVIPYPDHSHPAYRLVQEYFTVPRKFLFFDVAGLEAARRSEAFRAGRSFELLFLLRRPPPERLEVNAGNFVLGCTPLLNLFPRVSEPVRIDHRRAEYRLVPDARRPRSTEVHSILRVSASSDFDDRTRVYEPFFAFGQALEERGQRAFWHARRRESGRKEVPGTETWISFLDLDFNPTQPPSQTVFAHLLCTNRRLARQLPAGARFQLETAAPVSGIVALDRPTAQIDPVLGAATQWNLVSHLSLNYLSLSDPRGGLQALQGILRLYGDLAQRYVHDQINGIVAMSCTPDVARLPDARWQGFYRGTRIDLVFDEELYGGNSAFLFASVLNRFFGLYASINSFTRLVVRSRQREGTWKEWEPLAGDQSLL
ncbi:MAG TPA: type VI secretion system baseplate subunit TssF [Longimicrobiaceae bacterium]